MVASTRMMDFTTEVNEYLSYLYEGQEGWVCLAFWNADSDHFVQRPYQWPDQHEELTKDILADRVGVETYICPYLMKTKNRAKGNSVTRDILHVDLDRGLTKQAMSKLESDGFKLIRTGGGKTYHAYIKLARNLTMAEHRKYEEALREQLNGDDKITDNDLLRPPLTMNYKLLPHQVITVHKGRNLGPKETEAFLSWLDSINTTPPVSARTQWENTELKVPVRIPDVIRALMALPAVDGRRYKDCYAAVSSIGEAGFTLDECHAMLHEFAPGLQKFDHRTGGWHDQLDIIWGKWQAQNHTPSSELVPNVQVISETFWKASRRLGKIADTARSHQCHPCSVLGAGLAKILHSVPPRIWAGAPKGGDSIKSLNLFMALVGKTSDGKGKAVEIGLKLIDTGEIIDTKGAGSGEGISKLFKRRGKTGKTEWVVNEQGQAQAAVVSYVAEVSIINRLAERQGSTYFPELINAFDGGKLGFQNSDESKTVPVAANTYRFSLLVGVQPENAGTLLRDDNQWTGLAGRFLWLPAHPLEAMPEDYQAPEVEPIRWRSPEWEVLAEEGEDLARLKRLGMDGIEFPFCEEVRTDIRRKQHQRVSERIERGDEYNADPLDGHRIVLRKKVAIALALLHERTQVSERVWELAGQFMQISDHTRFKVQEVLADVGARTRRKKGRDKAEETLAQKEETERLYAQKHEDDIKEAARQIKTRMDKEKVDRIALGTAEVSVSKNRRHLFAEALSLLGYRVEDGLKRGQVVVRDRPLRARRRP